AQSPSFRQTYVLLEPKLDCFSRNTLICKSIWFCERLTWNPAESPVFDVSRLCQLEHEAAWCSTFSCLKTSQTGDSAGFQPDFLARCCCLLLKARFTNCSDIEDLSS
ncbi:hypothetical protein CSKR_103251, partial [Clonorchis sinensis]